MRKKIGELLIESGAVTEEQVRKALGQQRAFGRGQKLGAVLISLGYATPAAVGRALARQHDLPFMELPVIPLMASGLVPLRFQTEHRLVPFRLEVEGRNERLHVAVEDPGHLAAVDELRFKLRKTIRVYVAASDDIDRALAEARGDSLEAVDDAISLDDEPEASAMEVERSTSMVAGGWFAEGSGASPAAPPGAIDVLGWDEVPTAEAEEAPPQLSPRADLKKTPPPPPPAASRPAPAKQAPPVLQPQSAPPPPPLDSEDVLDVLLGEGEPEPMDVMPDDSADENKPRVPVVMFGGAAQGLPPPPPGPTPPDITEEDLAVLENIERMADGAESTLDTEKVKPARMVASLIRLLIRKRVIREEEFLEELSRK
jgi:hypothetical protein